MNFLEEYKSLPPHIFMMKEMGRSQSEECPTFQLTKVKLPINTKKHCLIARGYVFSMSMCDSGHTYDNGCTLWSTEELARKRMKKVIDDWVDRLELKRTKLKSEYDEANASYIKACFSSTIGLQQALSLEVQEES